jgi:hypothetical protein
MYEELKEYEKEEEEIEKGNCPYRGATNYSCSPHDGNCSCGFDEDGKVYCEEIRDKIIYLDHKIDDFCLLAEDGEHKLD